ncbi:MAG TPA: nuclear transport factor 2 family protein [Croceibacterium sp.]|nr:nuclear transport factor 2 family protein [Croceibacterium sp.]
MVRNWLAAAAAVGGIALGALAGPHVPGLAAEGAAAGDGALADRIAIEDMVTRYYGNFGKPDAAEDFGAFYTEDAVFDVNGIVSTGREAIEAFYTDTGDDAEAPAAQGTFHMMISNPVIDVNGDTATAEFMWTGVMNQTIDGRPVLWEQGREYDRLVKQDGAWRIQKRVVIADSGLPERYKATYQPRRDYDIAGE